MHHKIYTTQADLNVIVFLLFQNSPPKSKRFLVLLLRQQHAYAPTRKKMEIWQRLERIK